jgi:hypothetical protein
MSENPYKHCWTNEGEIPSELLKLLKLPNLPKDLQKEILQACEEVEQYGAVTYPTKARVEYYLHQYQDYISVGFLDSDNFTFIATNTTKYYLELTRNYGNRFCDEASLMATAGILDAQTYVFVERTISLSTILDTAQEATSSVEEDALVDFVTRLETKIFAVDNPNIALSDIVMSCIGQKDNIAAAIERTKREYGSECLFASIVGKFMDSSQFAPVRHTLGIKD